MTTPDHIKTLRDELTAANENLLKLEAAAHRQREIRDAAEAEAKRLETEQLDAETAAAIDGKPAPRLPVAFTAAKERACRAVAILVELDRKIADAVSQNDGTCARLEQALAVQEMTRKSETLRALTEKIGELLEDAMREGGPRVVDWLRGLQSYMQPPRVDIFADLREQLVEASRHRRHGSAAVQNQLDQLRDAQEHRWPGTPEGEQLAQAIHQRLRA